MSQRIQRVNGLIKQEISKILLKEIDFSDILVTITNIDTSPDLKSCKIKISVIPTDKNELALEIINKGIYQVQQELNKRLRLKYVPKISFRIDEIESKAQRIEEILSM